MHIPKLISNNPKLFGFISAATLTFVGLYLPIIIPWVAALLAISSSILLMICFVIYWNGVSLKNLEENKNKPIEEPIKKIEEVEKVIVKAPENKVTYSQSSDGSCISFFIWIAILAVCIGIAIFLWNIHPVLGIISIIIMFSL